MQLFGKNMFSIKCLIYSENTGVAGSPYLISQDDARAIVDSVSNSVLLHLASLCMLLVELN